MSIKLTALKFLTAAFILCIAGPSGAQVTKIDTSAYLPLFYSGSLEYNLTVAATLGYSSEIERLIKEGAKIDAENAEGATPLYFAILNKKTDAVKTLIRLGANVNKVSFRGETPLLLSIFNQDLNTAEALIRGGADINYQNRALVTPTHYAAAYGLYEFVDLLIYYDADTDTKDEDGTTPLMAAIWAGYPDIAELLIRNRANMEARDNDGFTPFLIAAQNGDTLIMNMLRKKGVDIYEKNIYDSDALALTIKSNHIHATEFLLRSGDKWRKEGTGALNPYNVAARYRRKEIMELLAREKVPGKYQPHFDRMTIALSSKFNLKDSYSGMNISFLEPLSNFGITAGIDTKLWYSRILLKNDTGEVYYQYFDRSSLVYAGVFKDFQLTDNLFKGNFYLSASLSAGYTFGNKYKGTEIKPENKFVIMPSAAVKWNKNALTLFAGLEYFNPGHYRTGPWLRTGCAFNFSFDTDRVPGKIIKWY